MCVPRRGGHGRTGTLVAVMLGRLYDLPASGALRLTQAYHDSRVYPQGVRSPQTTVQRAQVRRITAVLSALCTHSGSGQLSSVLHAIHVTEQLGCVAADLPALIMECCHLGWCVLQLSLLTSCSVSEFASKPPC